MLPEQKLDALLARHRMIESELASQVTPATYVRLSREFSELGPVIDAIKAYREVAEEIAGLEAMLHDAVDRCRDVRARGGREARARSSAAPRSSNRLRLALLPKDAMDERNVILEIRAGTGGDEASLFAGDLFRMYERYAAKQGWKVEVISASEGAVGGYKEIIAEVRGRGAFAKLKFESGVHRVQRVPDTEASGRIHTSTATVAVLPEAEDVDVTINEADLRIDTMRAGGAGGQHVNKTESAIRLTHIPTGIVVFMQEDRSQHRNRTKAMAVLRSRLYDFERQKYDAARAADRRGQVGSGDRSERIRTYNFPQGRVSDHRINLTLYKLPQIMEGEALGRDHRRAHHRASGRLAGRRGLAAMTMTATLDAPPSIATVRRSLAHSFRRHGLATPELDARLLVAHALGLDHAASPRKPPARADRGEADAIAALSARRLAREPVARIIGVKEFWGLDFKLNCATLVPRPETETVVEAALEVARSRARARCRAQDRRSRHRLGRAPAGAACPNCPWRMASAPISAATRSAAPATMRSRSASRNGLRFVACDFGAALKGPFDLVVANPPYVAHHEIAALAPEVRVFDPQARARRRTRWSCCLPGDCRRRAGVVVAR